MRRMWRLAALSLRQIQCRGPLSWRLFVSSLLDAGRAGKETSCFKKRGVFSKFLTKSVFKVESGATLIISPNAIVHQWIEEIQKHIKHTNISVLFYKGTKCEGYIQPRKLVYLLKKSSTNFPSRNKRSKNFV